MSLKASGLEWPPSVEPAKAPAIYAFALKRCSLYALKLAVERIVQGEEKIDRYIPTPPALAALVRKISVPLYADVARVRETLNTIEEGRQLSARDPDRAAARARVRELLGRFREEVETVRKELDPVPLRTEAELDRLFRNKQVEVAPPDPGKMSDAEWNAKYEADHAND